MCPGMNGSFELLPLARVRAAGRSFKPWIGPEHPVNLRAFMVNQI
jgi:hypothetical protein